MIEKYSNSIALVIVITAKLSGIAGVVCMFTGHYIPSVLFFVFDGLLLVATFLQCLKIFRNQTINLSHKCPSMGY
jgi:hypothetical protein